MSLKFRGTTYCECCGKQLASNELVFCNSCSGSIITYPPKSHPPRARKMGCRFCTDKNFEIRISVNKKNQATEKWENYFDYDINYCPCCGTKIEDIDF